MTEAVPLVEAAGVDVGVVHDDVQFEGTTRVRKKVISATPNRTIMLNSKRRRM